MAEGRKRELWDHTASLAAWVANCLGANPRVRPEALHPMMAQTSRHRGGTPITPENIDVLIAAFTGKTPSSEEESPFSKRTSSATDATRSGTRRCTSRRSGRS